MPKKITIQSSYLQLLFIICLTSLSTLLQAQIVNLPCQSETDGFLGLDRKDWNTGSTAAHSEGSLHNFDLPADIYGDCKKITNVSIEITATSADLSNLPPDCAPPGAYYINIASPCADFAPASCDEANLIAYPNSSTFNPQSLSYNSPPESFQFGDNLAIDIVPVMDVNCTNGQSALSSGSIVLEYDICVTVTISDDTPTATVDLGNDIQICPTATVPIDAGAFTTYTWRDGEMTQTITVGPDINPYTVTVTDANGCSSTDDILISSYPDSPITFNPAAPSVCDGGTINVSVNETYSNYAWSNSMTGQSQSLTQGTYSVTITDSNNCTAENTVTVTTIPTPNAGDDNTETICDDQVYDLTGMLSSDADTGGAFSDPNGSGALSGTMVDASVISGQTVDFLYTVGLATDPCGDDVATLTLTIEPAPNAGDDNTETICDDQVYDLTGMLSSDADTGGAFSDPNGSGALSGTMVDASVISGQTVDFLYTVGLATDPCGDDVATLTLTVEPAPNAGDDGFDTVCDGDPYDLNNLLSVNADTGGSFLELSGTGSLSGSSVNTLNLGGQTLIFLYTVGLASDPCGMDEATLTLVVDPFLSAGDDNSSTVCDGTMVNLNDLISGTTDFGGMFIDPIPTGTLSGSMVNTTGYAGQTLNFIYQVGQATDACGIDEAILSVIVTASAEAGDDNSITICEGNTIDLYTLISSNADGGGMFVDPIPTGALSGSMVNTTGYAGQTLNFIYQVGQASDPCGEDQATLTIIIETSLSAGDDNSVELCLSGIIDLENYLLNADLGGNFNDIDGSGGLSGSMLDTENILAGSYSYEYIVGDGITCPFDTADISVLFDEIPEATFDIDTIELCYNICQEINLSLTGAGPFDCDFEVSDQNGTSQTGTTITSENNLLSLHLCNDQSQIGFSNDTLNFHNLDSLLLTINNVQGENCNSNMIDSLWITSLRANIFEIDTSICIFDTIVINGIEFHSANSTYIDTLAGIMCDSFININVTFDDIDTSYIQETLCAGDSVNYYSTWFNETFPYDEISIATQSGCDSLVIVDISFFPQADTLLNQSLCDGDFIMVNGVTYDESNPIGQEILMNAAANGCDSLINIDLQFSSGINISRTDTLCEGSSIVIGGTVINESNNPNMLVVSGAVCDTTFDINLTFVPPSTNNITGTFCSDFDTIVNGNVYNVMNPADIEIITGGNYLGCDSIIIVDLQFENAVNIIRTDILCEGQSITIGGTVINESNNPNMLVVSGAVCDTTFDINLTFVPPSTNNITGTFCSDFDTIVNGNVYNIMNPADIEIITGGNYLGCDSIIIVDLSFTPCTIDISITPINNNCAGENSGAFEVEVISEVDVPYIILLEETNTGIQTTINVGGEQNMYVFENLASGDYTISIIDNTGVTLYTSSETISDVFSQLTGTWNLIDTIYCNGDLAQLEFVVVGGAPDYNYTWNTPDLGTAAIIDQVPSGMYAVTVSDMNGCTYNSSYDITEPLGITFTVAETEVSCIGIDDGSIEILNIQGGIAPYIIMLNGEEISETFIGSLAPGTYTVEVMDSESCKSMEEQITILNATNSQLANYTLQHNIEQGESITLVGDLLEDNLTFVWTPGTDLSCTDCASPMASPDFTTTYSVLITNEMGCEQIVNIIITVSAKQLLITTPNIFSPNGDGSNDDFIFRGEQYSKIEFAVYDRWGNLVHNDISTDGMIIWDGTTNGKELVSGVYIYQMILENIEGNSEVIVKDLTILR